MLLHYGTRNVKMHCILVNNLKVETSLKWECLKEVRARELGASFPQTPGILQSFDRVTLPL